MATAGSGCAAVRGGRIVCCLRGRIPRLISPDATLITSCVTTGGAFGLRMFALRRSERTFFVALARGRRTQGRRIACEATSSPRRTRRLMLVANGTVGLVGEYARTKHWPVIAIGSTSGNAGRTRRFGMKIACVGHAEPRSFPRNLRTGTAVRRVRTAESADDGSQENLLTSRSVLWSIDFGSFVPPLSFLGRMLPGSP